MLEVFAGGGGELLNQYVNQQELDLGAAALVGLEWGIINTVSALTGLPIKHTDGFWGDFVYSLVKLYIEGNRIIIGYFKRKRISSATRKFKKIKKYLIGVA